MTSVTVNCGTCRLCCKHELVAILPEHGDDPAQYETQTLATPAGDITHLRQKPNGDCIYLGEGGCTIYERRPAICRAFDCGQNYAMHSRAERRRRLSRGLATREMYDRGREVWLARQQP